MKFTTLTTGVIMSAVCAIACGSAAPKTATSPTSPTSGTGSLSGVVTTSAGVPLAGARVSIQPDPNSIGATAVTDVDGPYRFESLPARKLRS